MTGDGLDVQDLTVTFGGLIAVSDLTLSAPTGKITGLIGPNGAGKTTTFNACTGLLQPSRGKVLLFGTDSTQLSPMARARRGLGRTFQRLELFDGLTTYENVSLGREAVLASRGALRHVLSSKRDQADIREATEDALERCGLTRVARRPAGQMPTGVRRLIELARVLAGGYRFLLLDEPSAGLDSSETRQFGSILRDEVARGTGILLVEHDMSLVANVCEYVYVLDFGRLIFEGTMAEVGTSDVVREAYLGSETLTAAEPM